MREAVGNGKYRLQVEFLSGKARRCTPERAGAHRAIQPRSRGGSGSGPLVRPFSRRIRRGSSNPGEWDFAASGMASEMRADGSAKPSLAMQRTEERRVGQECGRACRYRELLNQCKTQHEKNIHE